MASIVARAARRRRSAAWHRGERPVGGRVWRRSRLGCHACRSLVHKLDRALGFLLIIKGFVNFRAEGRGTWMRKTIAPLPDLPEDEQPPVKPLSAEQARQLREQYPPVSP